MTRVHDSERPFVEVFCKDGLPVNYNTKVEQGNDQWLGYSFYKVTPSEGFTGGTLLTIHTTGIGKDTDISGAALAYHDGDDYVDFCTNF